MNFQFKQGVVVATRTLDIGTLYGIRVVPDMANIAETDLLPFYPNFFKHDHTAHQIDDTVWLLTNDDFHVGFILGQAQSASGDDISTFIQTINEAEQAAGLELSAYNQLDVIQYAGVSITFTNVVNGQIGTIYNNKTIIIYGADGSSWYSNPNLTIIASPFGDLSIQGNSKTEQFKDNTITTTNDSVETVGTKRIDSDGKMILTTGGTFEKHVSSSNTEYVGGDSNVNILGAKTENIVGGLLGGEKRNIVAGGSTTTVLEGDYNITVGAGAINLTSALPININSTEVSINTALLNLNGEIVNIGLPTGVVSLKSLIVNNAFGQVLAPAAPPGSGGFIPNPVPVP
jgi:hypothetical protein